MYKSLPAVRGRLQVPPAISTSPRSSARGHPSGSCVRVWLSLVAAAMGGSHSLCRLRPPDLAQRARSSSGSTIAVVADAALVAASLLQRDREMAEGGGV